MSARPEVILYRRRSVRIQDRTFSFVHGLVYDHLLRPMNHDWESGHCIAANGKSWLGRWSVEYFNCWTCYILRVITCSLNNSWSGWWSVDYFNCWTCYILRAMITCSLNDSWSGLWSVDYFKASCCGEDWMISIIWVFSWNVTNNHCTMWGHSSFSQVYALNTFNLHFN